MWAGSGRGGERVLGSVRGSGGGIQTIGSDVRSVWTGGRDTGGVQDIGAQ